MTPLKGKVEPKIRRLKRRLRKLRRSLSQRFSSSLTRRIVMINLGGLFILLLGFLYLNQFREGLIEARLQSLQTQSEIIAAAIASSASVETDAISIDPEKLLQQTTGQPPTSSEGQMSDTEFSINPEKISQLLHRLVSPTRTRARVYDSDGYLLLDTRALAHRRAPSTPEIAEIQNKARPDGLWARLRSAVFGRFSGSELPQYEDIGVANGKTYPEVERALNGEAESVVRINNGGETIVSIGAPILRQHVIHGALLLSTQGNDIDAIIASERWSLFRIFLVCFGVMLLLSLLFASAIAEPIRKLAEGAERVRRGGKSRHEIPDFSNRSDEIGYLSAALRDMMKALYERIEAIERFAADVAHELKNPLTSLRSAVETLPIARSEESKGRLMEIIQHDVKRLDRLISDISNASRLDAELARGDLEIVDLRAVATAVVNAAQTLDRGDGVTIDLSIDSQTAADWRILAHDSRLGQVLNNLVDNARSFSAPGSSVRLFLRPALGIAPKELARGQTCAGYEIMIDDDGPGIPAHAFERIFERFYTDRPNQDFGQNSGLGLSITKQIVEAHGGSIAATNRLSEETPAHVLGARFIVWLPAYSLMDVKK